jgi:5-methylcytosine-specific restriction endonuclease McrA
VDLTRIFEHFEDHLAPLLDTYEQAVYLYVLRHSRLVGLAEVTIGFKSARKKMAFGIGEAGKPMSEGTCYEKLRSLAKKGCLDILSTERAGTRVRLRLPDEIAGVVPTEATPLTCDPEAFDFFSTLQNRVLLLEREGHRCFYCLRELDSQNHVVEHVRSRPIGNNGYRNVVAACIQCNNRKGATAAEDYIRALYRDGFLNEGEFKQRLAMLTKLAEGGLKPDFTKAIAP